MSKSDPGGKIFRPCCTCAYDRRSPENGAYCSMFGWSSEIEARKNPKLCGRYGDAWEAKKPPPEPEEAPEPPVWDIPSGVAIYDRVMG